MTTAAPAEHILFLTGRLAYDSLSRELEHLSQRPPSAQTFSYRIHELGLKVAALMTSAMIQRRLQAADVEGVDRIIVPGLCSGDLNALSAHLNIPVQRGPKDLKDLPEFFGAQGKPVDLSQYAVRIFAEIVDARHLSIEQIVARARRYRADGADVIDLGCLPEVPFPHLSEAIQALQAEGCQVSVDSLQEQDLLQAGRAGADYLLSLKESTLWIADQVASVPVLIPEQPGDMESLYRAAETLQQQNRRFLADAILDPIHFGFTASLVRYHALRQRLPDAEIMLGTGNVTELTDADTTGMTALLLGIASELDIDAILTTEVSPHARTAVREADLARRMLCAAKRDGNLPRRYHPGLMALRDRKPFPYTPDEIATTAQAIKDPSYRIQLSTQGIHIYNRDGLHTAQDPFALFPHLQLKDDPGHAFYLGVELGRAQIAWQLGKRYLQDNQLSWGVVVAESEPELASGSESNSKATKVTDAYQSPGTTLTQRKKTPKT